MQQTWLPSIPQPCCFVFFVFLKIWIATDHSLRICVCSLHGDWFRSSESICVRTAAAIELPGERELKSKPIAGCLCFSFLNVYFCLDNNITAKRKTWWYARACFHHQRWAVSSSWAGPIRRPERMTRNLFISPLFFLFFFFFSSFVYCLSPPPTWPPLTNV